MVVVMAGVTIRASPLFTSLHFTHSLIAHGSFIQLLKLAYSKQPENVIFPKEFMLNVLSWAHNCTNF